MDSHNFDTLTRRLATGTSRRNLLMGLAGGSLAGVLAALRPRRGRADEKVLICHLTGSATTPVVLIKVDASAVPAHQAHGDAIDPDFSSDPAHCGGCFVNCDDGDPCTIDTCVTGQCVNTLIVCADGEECVDGACQSGTCLGLDVFCDPNDNRCCQDQPTSCEDTGCHGTATTCCHRTGDSCADACDCCGFSLCRGNKCCRITSDPCDADDQCCSGVCCNGVCCNDFQACCDGACLHDNCDGLD